MITRLCVLALVGLAACGGGSGTAPSQATSTDAVGIEDLVVGTGATAASRDAVTFHSIGMLTDGFRFENTYTRDQPHTILLGSAQLIAGFDQGVPGMRIGGKRRLTVPPSLGYGDKVAGPIPPNSTLIYEIELLSIRGK
jgi:FKBP-type peptidyl-prolyl cis-trans isomerase